MSEPDIIDTLRQDVRREAKAILHWWQTMMPDDVHGGFVGEIDADDRPVAGAAKSVILNTRLLWFFSAMVSYLQSDEALALAHRAVAYIRDHFLDPDHGGLYWLLDHKGQVIDAKKQAYAQAFGLYALAEYVRITGDAAALDMARQLQRDIEGHFWDTAQGGYIEALSAFWHDVGDQRLSDKDMDAPKTMNTHLHVLEAYTNLHRAAPDAASQAALRRALDIFVTRFADSESHHLRLFCDMDWRDRTNAVSFGHDIEASWLIWEAAVVLDDADMLSRISPLALGMAKTTLDEGMNDRGGLSYERGLDGHVDPAGEWWGQAEAMVGFANAWHLTGDAAYLDATRTLWSYVQDQYGAGRGDEWTWYASDAGKAPQVKAGQWKCPYHNGRAMIELDHRLKAVQARQASFQARSPAISQATRV